MKKFLYLIPLLLICSYANAQTWQPHPLLTEAQQLAGYAGGEGNQWQKVIEFAPSNPNIVYKGIDTSSIWKSTDGGASWVHKSKGITSVYARGIAIKPSDPDKVCVAMRSLYGNGVYGSAGIFRTTNGGDTWTYVHHASTGSISGFEMTDVITWEGTSNALYCGSQSKGIVKSTDEGLTWSNLNASGTHTFSGCQVTNVQVDPTNTNVLFACVTGGTSSTGLHKLTLSGTTVTARQYLSASKGGTSFPNKSFKTANGNIYICRYSGDTRGIYRSTDGGSTFSAINSGITSLSSYSLYGFEVSADGLRAAVTQMDRRGNSYWYCNNITAATPTWQNPVSVDVQNAKGWIAGSVVRPAQASEQESSRPTAFHPTNSQIMLTAVQFDVLVKSTNGGQTWTFSNSGFLGVTGQVPFSQTDSNSVMWDITNPNRWMFSGGDYGARFTNNAGVTYKPMFPYVSPVGGRSVAIAGAIEPGGNVCVLAIGNHGNQELQRCADISATSPSFSTVLPGTHTYSYISFNGSSTSTIYAGDRISYNKGVTWSTTPGGRTIGAVNPRNHNVVYDAVQSGSNILIYKSTNSGSTWTQPFASCNISGFSYIGQFCIDPFDENRAYIAVRGKGIYTITTSSATLSTTGLVKSATGYFDFTSVACDPKTPGTVYAAAFSGYLGINGNGVFKSTDYGTTWVELVEAGGTADASGLNVSPHTGIVFNRGYAGTYLYDPNQSEAPPPVGGLPSVSTGTATSVTSTTATLQGSVNPNNLNTTYRFQYNTANNSWGTATNTGSQTVSSSYGTQNVGVTQGISGLTAGTNYFTRIQANNGSGSVSGNPTTFTTLSSRKLFEISKVGTSAITIDGDLSEWGTLENSIPNTTAGVPVSSGTWSARWIDGSAGGLYLAIQVSDSNQYADSGTSTPYQDDSVEYYIDRDNNKGSTYDSYDRNIKFVYGSSSTLTVNTGTTTGILLAGSNTASTWTKEVFIPWSLFPGGVVPSTGTIIGFDTQLNDDNNGGSREGAKTWNNVIDANYYDTSNFGEIELAGYPAPPASPCSVSSSNLVAHFAMNESSGTTVSDHSLKNNTGTITGAVFTSGQIGNSLDFDGVDDYVSFPNESYYDFNRTDSFSVTAWIKVATSTTNTYYLVSKVFGGVPYNGWTMAVDYDAPATGYLFARLCYIYSTNVLEKQSSVRVDSNTWRHVAFTFAGTSTPSGLNVYVDGALSNGTVTYNSLSASILNNQALVIGNFAAGGAPTDGLIDDVRIYDKVLSADEISCIYNDTTPLSVASTIPGSASAGIALDTNVDITFNEALDTSWAGTSTFSVGTVTGSVSQGTGTLQFNPTSNLNIATTYPVTLSSKLRDTTGNVMLNNYIYNFTTLIGTDTTAPVGTITLHNGATYTTDQSITADLTATDGVGVVGYFLSEGSATPYATQTGWVSIGTTTDYSSSIPYTLTEIDELKTIFAWFKDGSNNISNMDDDSVILDSTYTSISIGTPTSSCELYSGSKVYGTTGSFINMGGNAFDTNLVTQVKINNNNTSTVNTAVGTETWSANNQRVICALDDGLVFYAKLDEPNGAVQILDSSIYGVVGSNTGSVIGTTSVFGHSRYFDGVDDGISFVINSGSVYTSTISISAWVRPEIVACGADCRKIIVNKAGLGYIFIEDNVLQGRIQTTGSTNVAWAKYQNFNIFLDKMTHVVFVFDKAVTNTARFYVNGIAGTSAVSIATQNNIGTDTAISIGFLGVNKYKGYIDDVRIYNRALSQAEITQLYQLTTPEIDNTFSTTGFDTPGNQGTDTIHVGNFAVPVTMDAGSITSSSAILYGSVTPNLGGTVTVSFEYGIESGIYAGSSTAQLFAGTTTVKDVGITLGVLNSETAYFYRLIATNNLGTTVSGEMSFTTEASTPAGGNSSTILRWRSYDEFHTTGFHSYLKEINKYRSFFKNIRSTQDWVDLIADPDAVLSALPAD